MTEEWKMSKFGRFRIWCPVLGQTIDDSMAISAAGEAKAVMEWAAEHDKRDPLSPSLIANGNDLSVVVRDLDRGTEREWIARGELIPQYHARLIVSA